jgi:hypothetical protein
MEEPVNLEDRPENTAPDLTPDQPDPDYVKPSIVDDDEPGEAPDQQADNSPRNDPVPE